MADVVETLFSTRKANRRLRRTVTVTFPAHADHSATPIGNLAGSCKKVSAGDTRMHAKQLIEFVVDDASTIAQEVVDTHPSTPARL